jgi:hypothetical protein
MATRIDIQVAQALLMEKLRGIAGLNREQRLERERQAKEQAQIKAAADKAAADRDKAQRKSGVPEYHVPPKVAATGRPMDVKLAWCWTGRNTATDTTPNNATISSQQNESSSGRVVNLGSYYRAPLRRDYLIVSGDGSATLPISLEMPEAATVRAAVPAPYSVTPLFWDLETSTVQSSFSVRTMVLPTGTDGVGVLAVRHDYRFVSQIVRIDVVGPDVVASEYDAQTFINRGIGCWLVSPSAIRALSTPSAFAAASDAAGPSLSLAYRTNPLTSSTYPGLPLPPQPYFTGSTSYYEPGSGDYTADHGWWDPASGDDSTTTPLEFQRLQLIAAYSPPSRVVWVEPDYATTPGLFADSDAVGGWEAPINTANPMRWRSSAFANADVPAWPDRTPGALRVSNKLTRSMNTLAPVPSEAGGMDYSFHAAHNYSNSANCRQQLLALGFTPEDLTP